MSPVLSRRVVKELMQELRAIWPRETLHQRFLMDELGRSLKPKRSVKASRVRRVAKKKTRKEEWAEVRAAVLDRANGVCENCKTPQDRLAADHMFGGAGRRVSLESKFTVWALCFTCDQNKTRNVPSAGLWLRAFIDHAGLRARQASFVGRDAEASGYQDAVYIAARRLDSMALRGRTGEQT